MNYFFFFPQPWAFMPRQPSILAHDEHGWSQRLWRRQTRIASLLIPMEVAARKNMPVTAMFFPFHGDRIIVEG